MTIEQILFITIIAILIFIPVGTRIFQKIKRTCPKCGNTLKLDETIDSMGINISKKITVSIYQGPRKRQEIWICSNCGHKTTVSYQD